MRQAYRTWGRNSGVLKVGAATRSASFPHPILPLSYFFSLCMLLFYLMPNIFLSHFVLLFLSSISPFLLFPVSPALFFSSPKDHRFHKVSMVWLFEKWNCCTLPDTISLFATPQSTISFNSHLNFLLTYSIPYYFPSLLSLST